MVNLLAVKLVRSSMTEEVGFEHVLAYAEQFQLRCKSKSRGPLPPLERRLDVVLNLLSH